MSGSRHPGRRWAIAAGTISIIAAAASGPASGASAAPGGLAALPSDCASGAPLASGTIATIAGDGTGTSSGDDGPALAAGFSTASGTMAVRPDGTIVFSDSPQAEVRSIDPTGVIHAVAADFEFPLGTALDASGDVLVADRLVRLRRIGRDGAVSTVAGLGASGSTGNDGPAAKAQVNPTQVAVGPDGSVYIDDTNNYRVIRPDGVIHAFAGSLTPGFEGDGSAAVDARFGEGVNGIAVAPDGTVYLGDPANHRVRRVDPSGVITTIAGTGEEGTSGDGGQATAAALDDPHSLALDPAGNLYIGDDEANVIRRIDPSGVITTIAGTGAAGFSGDCGPATAAAIDSPDGIAIHDGAVVFTDSQGTRLRLIVP
jgi:sugar lactone lactonase YvrE